MRKWWLGRRLRLRFRGRRRLRRFDRIGRGGVACEGELADAYRACLESRIALRVLLQVARFPVADGAALYTGVAAVDWGAHMDASGTLAVDFSGSVPGITHTQFGAQRVKDAVVDQFRDRTGSRPSVDRESPMLRINAHAARGALTLAIDLSGESLHRRGYRGGAGAAASVKALSLRRGITLIAMESAGMWQQVGFLADVFAEFKRHGLSVDLIGSAETNVTVSLDPTENLVDSDVLAALCSDLARVCRVKVIGPCAAITRASCASARVRWRVAAARRAASSFSMRGMGGQRKLPREAPR